MSQKSKQQILFDKIRELAEGSKEGTTNPDPRFEGTRASSMQALKVSPEVIVSQLCFNSPNQEDNCVVKVYLWDSKNKAEEVYGIRNQMPKDAHVVRLLTKEPFYLDGGLYGIMMHLYPAKLEDLLREKIELDKRFTESEILTTIRDMVQGASHIHRLKKAHSDITLYNAFVQDLDTLRVDLSDFSESILRSGYDTMSGKNATLHQSPELRNTYTKGGVLNYGPSEDVFQIGHIFYMLLARELEGFQKSFVVSPKGQDYATHIDETIRASSFDPRIKQILRMFVNPERPKVIPNGGNWDDFRCADSIEGHERLEQLLKVHVVNGTSFSGRLETSLHSKEYFEFLDARDYLSELFDQVDHHRTDMWGTLDNEFIDDLIKAYAVFKSHFRNPEIKSERKLVPQVNRLIKRYKQIKMTEANILVSQSERLQRQADRNPPHLNFDEFEKLTEKYHLLGWPIQYGGEIGGEPCQRVSLAQVTSRTAPFYKELDKLRELARKYD